MSAPVALRILWIEDSAEDAELFSAMLEDEGLGHAVQRVEDEAGLLEALAHGGFDVAISDLDLPGFSGHRALEIVRTQAPRLPFVFLSGAMGEEAAVLALHQGATDYVLKQSPRRLCSAVRRAVREAEAAAERERVAAELVRAERNQALALLVAGLSHDLRNVLAPLGLWPHLLRAQPDAATIARGASVIEECARRGQDLAQAMIDFARGHRSGEDATPVAAMLAGVRLLLEGSVPAHVAVRIDDRTGGAYVRGHATELQQCLLNLCLNAVQAMTPMARGLLEVEACTATDDPDAAVHLQVRDTGPGMDEAVLARLFTPFFTTKADGTGLGMLSCRRIVESLGGRLEVDSRPGEGTRMRLTLARAEPAAAGSGAVERS